MPNTYEKIQTNTLTSANTSVTFSSIPSSYTDLVIIGTAYGTSGAVALRYNNDSGASQYSVQYYSSTSASGTPQSYIEPSVNRAYLSWHGATIGTSWIGIVINIYDYANTTTYKSANSRLGGKHETSHNIFTWKSNAAINSVTIFCDNNMNVDTTFTLYGIKAA